MTVSAKIEPQIATLDEIRDYVWNALERAAHNRHDAFHTAMTGTISEFGCQMRTVILRKVDRHSGTLFFHTDYRSVKIRELEKDHRLSWLFYDADRKVQIRAASTAAVHYQDAVARERWQASSLSSRRCYLAPSAPGQFTPEMSANVPEAFLRRNPTTAESESGWQNFCAVAARVNFLDWLYLHSSGHQRAQFVSDNGEWQGNWVTP
jgi:3-hydroxyisobutyrate dehydrogenase